MYMRSRKFLALPKMPVAQTGMKGNSMEHWEIIGDFPDFEVSYEGNIRRVGATKLCMQSSNDRGIIKVNLVRDFQFYTRSVARIVCRTFHGEPQEGEVVLYRDNDPSNVHGDNLFWSSRGNGWEMSHQRNRTDPMRNQPIERIRTGEIYDNSLDCANAVGGIEKTIVYCAGDPMNRFYRGSNYRWVRKV